IRPNGKGICDWQPDSHLKAVLRKTATSGKAIGSGDNEELIAHDQDGAPRHPQWQCIVDARAKSKACRGREVIRKAALAVCAGLAAPRPAMCSA
ncbi:MAG: hypothetical protein WAK48_10480, partial [Candidatus Acidiferrum sp.]